MGIEYGKEIEKNMIIVCDAHGQIAEVPANMVDDQVKAHRENLGCYFNIRVGLKNEGTTEARRED